MRRFGVVFVLGAVAGLAAGSAVAAEMPPQLRNAQYVLLAYDLGDRVVPYSEVIGRSHLVTDADRAALERVWDQVEAWDRFVLVQRASEADVIFAIRTGRRGSVDVSLGASAELGTSDDMLSVYEEGRPGLPLWREHAPDGLSGDVPLLQSFRAALEAAFD